MRRWRGKQKEPRMRKFWSVSGQLVEVHRYINVPMRWCEQYPARERRELWVSAANGQDVKLIVHSREMPARRGHQVTALLLRERLVGVYNASTGKQVNYVRTDPPLLWRRCDAAAVAALSMASIGGFVFAAVAGTAGQRADGDAVCAVDGGSAPRLAVPHTSAGRPCPRHREGP